MKLLVTGAAGFIGSHLAEALSRAGHLVTGLDAFTPFYDPSLKEENARAIQSAGATLLRQDLATDDLTQALEGVDAVFHLAAQPGLSSTTTFDDYLRNNLVATARLLAACEATSPRPRFLHISTSSVYGAHATGDETTLPEPTSIYGVTKLAAEQLALSRHRERALETCSLRIFSVYGPRERPDKLYSKLLQSLLDDHEIPIHEGSEHHRRSYTFITDILRGLFASLERWDAVRGEILNLGSDIETTTADGIALAERLTGKRARILRAPKRTGDQLRTHANIDKARRLLDYTPRTTLEEGLRAELAWFEDRRTRAKSATTTAEPQSRGGR